MRKALYLFFAFTFATATCQAAVTKLPEEDRRALFKEANFHEVHSSHDLPASIVALCADGNGQIAEPGQEWQPTDVVDPSRKLLARRLIWGAIGGNYYVVHYETGGIAHMFHILVATLPKGALKPKVVWEGTVPYPQFDNYKAFLEGLRQNKLSDDLH